MSAFSGDWLDRLARGSVGAVYPELHADESTPADEERYSRGTAVKLAAAGVASVSLGLWRAEPGLSQDAYTCLKKCNTTLDELEYAWIDACYEKFGESRKWSAQTPGWKQVLLLVTFPGTMVQQTLAGFCSLGGSVAFEKARRDCWPECQRKCGTRASQSRSLSDQVCQPPPPPKSKPPVTPPAPNMTEDPCWACNANGDMCCGPYTGDPETGTYTNCGCVAGEVSCEAVGCG